MNKKLLKQNFIRCDKCGKSVIKGRTEDHICELKYFNYRLKFKITSSINDAIKQNFNITDKSIITAELEKEITKFRLTKPAINNPIAKKIQLSENQILSHKTVDEVFQQQQISELISRDEYSKWNKFEKNTHRIFFNDIFYDSYFTKNQIIHLANGVGETQLNKLVSKLQRTKYLSDDEWLYLIRSIENLLPEYGPEKISDILETSPLPHSIGKVENIFNVINNLSQNIQNPIIRLRNEGAVFIIEPLVIKNERYYQILTIRQRDQQGKSSIVGHLGSNGHFYKNIQFKVPIVPTIQLILKWNNNINDAIAYFGLNTGECSICGRQLTDKTSIKIGIGPICRRSLQI
jgi:hypothetical protein